MSVHEDFKLFDRKTDPRFTKKVSVGQRSFTNIDAYYLIQELTKVFGLYGKGFGVKDIEHTEKEIGDTILVISKGVFFFDGGSFIVTTSGKLSYMTKQSYIKIDEDIYKKNETNLLSKGASKIGFGTDIYLGKWEDQDYVNEAWGETEITLDQLQQLTPLITSTKTDATAFNKEFNISKLKELKQEDFNKALAMLQAKQAKMQKGQ